MKSDKQVEASASSRRAIVYRQISAVFDQMPDRFEATQLYMAAGIKKHRNPVMRALVASVLNQDFKCERSFSEHGSSRYWRKPIQEIKP